MASSSYEGGAGGKFRKRSLRMGAPTPYDRPLSEARGIHGSTSPAVSRGNRWLLNIVDPASRVIARSASRLFSSVFRKRLTAPPGGSAADGLVKVVNRAPKDSKGGTNLQTPGEKNNASEEVLEVSPSPEVREQDDNPFDARFSRFCVERDRNEQESISGTDDIVELEQLVKQKSFSRYETERLTELLRSRTVEASTIPSVVYKNKGKLAENSNIDPDLSEQAVNYEDKEKKYTSVLEDQRKHLVTQHEKISSGVGANIPLEGFGSPIEIARAYMGSRSLKATPSTLHLKQSQISSWDKGSPSSLPFGHKQSNAADTSKYTGRFAILPADPGNKHISPIPSHRPSYKFPRFPYCTSPTISNTREYSPYKGSYIARTKSIERTSSSSNIRHSVHGQVSKRGSSDIGVGGSGDVRRVRQKSCLKELHSSSCADVPSCFVHQGNMNEIDMKGLENVDGRLPAAGALSISPQSTQMAQKILHQLDKLVPSPQNLSSEKKVTFEDTTFSNSSLGAFHEVSQRYKGNNSSTKLVNVPGRSRSGVPSSSTSARIMEYASSNKDKAKEMDGSPIPSTSGAITSASDVNGSTRSMNSNGRGFSFFSTQKNPIIQSAADDRSTKAQDAVFSSVKESREKSIVHSVKFAPTFGLMHAESGAKSPVELSTEKDASFKFPAAHTFNTLSQPVLFSTAETITFAEGNSVSTFEFGLTNSTANVIKSPNTGLSASVQTGETIIDAPTLRLDKGVSATPSLQCNKSVPSSPFTTSGISANSSNPYSASGAPKFQFGSGNSTICSFTGLSAASSSLGNVSSMGNGTSKFQFGSGNSTSYSFAGLAASSSENIGGPRSIFSPLHPPEQASANGILAASTSRSFQNSAMNFDPTPASSSGTPATSSGNGNMNFSHSSVREFGSPFSVSPQLGFATSGAKQLRSSSPFSFSTSFSPVQPGFGLTNTTNGFGSGSLSNDQNVNDSRVDGDPQAAPTGLTSGQPSNPNLRAIHSGTQAFQFENFQNNSARNSSPLQESGNPGFSPGGVFSLGSGGAEKSERTFRRFKRRK